MLSKSRVAPLQTMSIPRLELLSASLGLKLAKKVVDIYQISMDKMTFWCDSMNVLWWIKGRSRQFKPFVANRVGEIQSITNPAQWRYVPTKENPADLVSRGSSIDKLNSTSQWVSGPCFLRQLEENWPASKFEKPLEETMEIKKNVNTCFTTYAVPTKSNKEWRLDPTRYSKWTKLIRVTVWVKRFLDNCRSLKEHRDSGELTVDEIIDAENHSIRTMQQEQFSEEYKDLSKGKEIPSSSKILALQP